MLMTSCADFLSYLIYESARAICLKLVLKDSLVRVSVKICVCQFRKTLIILKNDYFHAGSQLRMRRVWIAQLRGCRRVADNQAKMAMKLEKIWCLLNFARKSVVMFVVSLLKIFLKIFLDCARDTKTLYLFTSVVHTFSEMKISFLNI